MGVVDMLEVSISMVLFLSLHIGENVLCLSVYAYICM